MGQCVRGCMGESLGTYELAVGPARRCHGVEGDVWTLKVWGELWSPISVKGRSGKWMEE
jgi:hypothetical protein